MNCEHTMMANSKIVPAHHRVPSEAAMEVYHL
jgi:hypothetical protein